MKPIPQVLWNTHKRRLKKFCGVQRRLYFQFLNEVYDENVVASCFHETIFCFLPLMNEETLEYIDNFFPEVDTFEKKLVFLLAHEMQHAKQYEDGRLDVSISKSGSVLVTWEGQTFRKKLHYRHYPWEVEANVVALTYVRNYFK